VTDDLVTVAAFQSAVEAQNCRAALEQHGVMATLADEHTVASDWLYSAGIGGVKLRVRASDAALARQVLAGARRTAVGCPRCGSPRTARGLPRGWSYLALLVMCMFGLPFAPFWLRRWSCGDCGARWKSRFDGEPAPPEAGLPNGPLPQGIVRHAATAPWRWRGRSLLLSAGVAIAVGALGFGLDWRGLLAGAGAGVVTLGGAAFLSWTWEEVTLTFESLVIETADSRVEWQLGELRAARLPDGSEVVEGPEGPVLASAASGLAGPEAVLLEAADLHAIWGAIAPSGASTPRPS
jgi:hypothetical protein